MATTAGNSNGHSGAKFTLRALLLFMTMLCVACGGLAYLKELVYPTRGFTNREALYRPLKEPWIDFEEAAEANGLILANAEYYRVRDGWDCTYFIRFDDSQYLFDFLVKKTGLSPLTTRGWYYGEFWDDLPTEWKTISPDMRAEMYVCKSLTGGGESDQYVVLRDRQAGKIYVWYHFNF